MTDLSTSEQRKRAGVSPSGRLVHRGPPRDRDTVRGPDGETRSVVPDQGNALDERPPPDWEDKNSEQVREAWGDARREMTDSIRAARRKLPRLERLERALGRLARISNLRSRPIAAGRSTSEDSPGGRRPPGSGEHEFDRYLRVVDAAIESLEHALDVEEGIAPGRSAALMGTVEKDRELFTSFAGVPAGEVADTRPEQGSRATVYRRRRAAGLDSMGLDPETGLAPTPERVNECVLLLSREGRRVA